MNISIAAEQLFHIGAWPVTNTLLVAIGVSLVLMAFGLFIRAKLAAVPGTVQNVAELLVDGALGVVESVTHDRAKAEKFLPIVFTIFLFVILSNWVEVIPGLGTIGVWQTHEGKAELIPFLRSASADLNVTLALAIFSVMAIQVVGITSLGAWRYVSRFFNFHSVVGFFVGLLELVLEMAKIISFSFRLFGNIFAGEVLLLVMLFLVPYLVPLPFLALELFVGFVQALVFAMLTTVFLYMATLDAEH
jgi:F-type H+-transporting ATPase subunit a